MISNLPSTQHTTAPLPPHHFSPPLNCPINTPTQQDLHPPLRTRLSPLATHRLRAQTPEDVEDRGRAERASLCEAEAAACVSEDEGRVEGEEEEVSWGWGIGI